nr:cytochrome P450 [Tanacetum cinerariifolium]
MPNNTVKGDQPTMLILAGKTFAYSAGNIHFLCITDPELVKEVSLHASLDLGKPSYISKDRGPMFGQGILSSNGPYWSHKRKIIAPHLYPDKVKDMVTLMANATSTVLHSWESKIKQTGDFADIRIDNDLRSVSADIISRACFGSNYSQGEMIFSKLRALQGVMSKASIGVPVLRDKLPDMTMLQSMKTLTMVIQEALRLYPPVAFTVREALKDIQFRNILIPKGIDVQTVIPMLHQHPELWGPDVYEFKPERFAEGTKGACKCHLEWAHVSVQDNTLL